MLPTTATRSGCPPWAGAILYDPAYTTNPLVFAGCIGTATRRGPSTWDPTPGDRVLVLGGATGRDGIRGRDLLVGDDGRDHWRGRRRQCADRRPDRREAADRRTSIGAEDLYSAITDCGAGGLSSAVGEMAEGIGADVDLHSRAARKYPGLEPWEVWAALRPRSAWSSRCPHRGT